MQKCFWVIVVVLLIVGCNSNKSEFEQKPVEPSKSEEKADSISVPEQETEVEKVVEQVEEKIEDEATLWSSYRSAKDAVKQAGNDNDYEKQAKHLLEAARYANALQRFDIESWQYNNAGFTLIKDFKNRTDYVNVMKKLNSLKLKSDISKFREETRAILTREKELLLEANGYLVQAKEIDSHLEKSSRTTTIASNIAFVNDVLSFLNADELE